MTERTEIWALGGYPCSAWDRVGASPVTEAGKTRRSRYPVIKRLAGSSPDPLGSLISCYLLLSVGPR